MRRSRRRSLGWGSSRSVRPSFLRCEGGKLIGPPAAVPAATIIGGAQQTFKTPFADPTRHASYRESGKVKRPGETPCAARR